MANFPQRHPLAALLLLLALLPALIGGSLTHTCGCRGLVYVGGCACYAEEDAATRADNALGTSEGACMGELAGARTSSCSCTASAPDSRDSDTSAPDSPFPGSSLCSSLGSLTAPGAPPDASSSHGAEGFGLSDHHGHSCDSLALEMEHPSLLRDLPSPPVAALSSEPALPLNCSLAALKEPLVQQPPCFRAAGADLVLPLLL